MSCAASEGRSTRRLPGHRARLAGLLAALVSLGAAGSSHALTVMDGELLEVPFVLSEADPPRVAGVDPPDVVLVDPVVTGSGVIGWDVELWDGATLLGTSSTGPTTDPWAFTTAASGWEINAVHVDLSSVIDGSIEGRVRLTPHFAPTLVASSVEIEVFPPPGRGLKVGIGSTDPTLSFAAASPLPELQGDPVVLPVPEPAAALLLLGAALLPARRLRH